MSILASLNHSFKRICPLFFPRAPASPITSKQANVVGADLVTNWLQRFDVAFPQFERIAANGAYSLLEKEIVNITPLLREGQVIVGSSPHLCVAALIDANIKPRLNQLKQCCTNSQRKIAASPKIKEEDEKTVKKWENLGLPISILKNHMDCARFLIESSLAFKIVGYRETCTNPDLHDVKLDSDGHPMIKIQGTFKRWELVKRELTYDSKTDHIRSLRYPGSVVQSWTYLAPNGLVPIDRLTNDRIVPIYQLNPNECQRVVENARKFYETNVEVDPGAPKDWVVQFHTSPRRQFVSSIPPLPKTPLLDKLARNLNTHIVMRLIAPDGDVYSFGLEMPSDSQDFLWEGGMAKFLGTVTAKINKAGDYEEFKPHVGRVVTSIPLSAQRADNILRFINNSDDIRFNFLRQNCANLMSIVLKQAGYDLDTQTTVKQVLIDSIPEIKHVPFLGPVIDKVNQLFKKIFSAIGSILPKPIANAITAVENVVYFIPRKMGTLAINLFIKYFGGAKMLSGLPDGVPEDDLYHASRFLNFSRLIRSWKDLFKEQTLELYHSKYFIDWQKKQKSTFISPGSLCPKLAIVPPLA
jgi:hypothetical protein